jgi:hypothetical protein
MRRPAETAQAGQSVSPLLYWNLMTISFNWWRAFRFGTFLVTVLAATSFGHAQKRNTRPPAKPPEAPAELEKVRQNYIQLTKDYKESLQALLTLYEASEHKAEDRLTQAKGLYQQGIISKVELDNSDQAVTLAKAKVTEVKQQMSTADTQIAQTLVEIEGDKQIAKLGRMRKGGFIRTTSFVRYNGAAAWSLSQAGTIEAFFQQRFGRPLPIAVFGQGAIHNQWHLDHHNAMDISLNPDGAEGQALMEFLRSNGIPFSAFRGAIPGVATGPHIHIGLPSHRY